jgi:cellobiose epimerase
MNRQPHSHSTGESGQSFTDELAIELDNILGYWERFTPDYKNGGFFGQIDQENQVVPGAARGSVLHSRILWTFSAAYRYTQNPRHLELAAHAYQYIRQFITDPLYGGLYWSVDADGNMLDGHKQVYAQAFGVYALSEYYRVSAAPEPLQQALEIYHLIEKYSRDALLGGYTEAFSRDWSFLADRRLSTKDENASKSMNTHLHLVEAYANLFEVYPDENLKKNIIGLLAIFNDRIINRENHHLGLFFSEDWQMDGSLISYGHDIEAGWLLLSCAESIADPVCISVAEQNALIITDSAMEGLDGDGGLWYEYDQKTGELVYEKHWWPQAEALIGFCNAWQLSGEGQYKNAMLKTWGFIKRYMLDTDLGEWYWGVNKNNIPMPGEDKVGIWKCPYHNTRAMLELLKRLEA